MRRKGRGMAWNYKLLDAFVRTRTGKALDRAAEKDFEYCEIMRRQDIAIAEVEKAGLSKEQYIVVDKALSETNEYARILSVVAYRLGLQDGIRLKREVRGI